MIVQMIGVKLKWYKNNDWLMFHKNQNYLHIFSDLEKSEEISIFIFHAVIGPNFFSLNHQ
jgi:hypothetical protein